jgi:hypothetical protein
LYTVQNQYSKQVNSVFSKPKKFFFTFLIVCFGLNSSFDAIVIVGGNAI